MSTRRILALGARLPRVQHLLNYWGIPFIVNLLAAGFVYVFTNDKVYTFLLIGAFAFGSLVAAMYYESLLRSVSVKRIVPLDPLQAIPLTERISGISREFVFFGVSGLSLWDTNIFEYMMDSRNRKCRFRFLLLNPSSSALVRHAEREGINDPATVRDDIMVLANRLSQCKEAAPNANIEVRFISFDPMWWILKCDDKIYFHTFPRGKIGKESALMLFGDSPKNNAFYVGLSDFLDEVWHYQST
jgi:hypothetical protein